MVDASGIIEELKKCGVRCGEGKSVPDRARMEHEAMKMKKPASHEHHAMMEAEMKRRFIVAAIFTVPVLFLSPSIQAWAALAAISCMEHPAHSYSFSCGSVWG